MEPETQMNGVSGRISLRMRKAPKASKPGSLKSARMRSQALSRSEAAKASKVDVVYTLGTQSFMGQRTLVLKVVDFREAVV